MALVAPESFGHLQAGALADVAGPALHRVKIVVDAMLLLEPLALAGVAGKHLGLLGENRLDVHVEIGWDRLPLPIYSADRIHEIQMRNRRQGSGSLHVTRGVVAGWSGETGVAYQGTGGFVI